MTTQRSSLPPPDDLFIGLPAEASDLFVPLCRFCIEHEADVLAALPWMAAEIAGNEGFAAMLSFVRRLSGARLHVSPDLARFRSRVGFEATPRTHASIVRGATASALVDVPSAWGVFLTLRRLAIRDAIASGTPPGLVARRFGVSERSLRS